MSLQGKQVAIIRDLPGLGSGIQCGLTGIRLAKPRFGRLSIDEEEDVMQEGRRSYQLFLQTGIWPTNPYMSKKEAMAHEFWGFGLTYAQTEHVGDGFKVLGTPTPVTVIAKQPDGTTIYSIPAQADSPGKAEHESNR